MFQSKKSHRLMALALSAVVGLTATFAAAETVTPTVQNQYIPSGSLLGVELKDVRFVPVGYMDVLEMYPLDFEKFAYANKVSPKIIDALCKSFQDKTPVDTVIHEKMMELLRLYLIVGGMPAGR